jgi:hypothetical protein
MEDGLRCLTIVGAGWRDAFDEFVGPPQFVCRRLHTPACPVFAVSGAIQKVFVGIARRLPSRSFIAGVDPTKSEEVSDVLRNFAPRTGILFG